MYTNPDEYLRIEAMISRYHWARDHTRIENVLSTQTTRGSSTVVAHQSHRATPALETLVVGRNFNKVIHAMNHKRRDPRDPRTNILLDVLNEDGNLINASSGELATGSGDAGVNVPGGVSSSVVSSSVGSSGSDGSGVRGAGDATNGGKTGAEQNTSDDAQERGGSNEDSSGLFTSPSPGSSVSSTFSSTSSSSSTNLPSEKDTPMDSFKLHSSQIRVLNEIGGKGTPLYRSPMELMSIKQSNSVKKTNKTLSSRSFDQFSADTGSMFPFSHNSAYRARRAAHSQQMGGGSSSGGSSKSMMSREQNEAAAMVSQAAAKAQLDKQTLNDIIKNVRLPFHIPYSSLRQLFSHH